MMTPAGWAHLDYETDETAEQLQQTLDQSGRDIEPFGRYVLYQAGARSAIRRRTTPSPCATPAPSRRADIVPIDYHLSSDEGDITYRSQGSHYSDRHEWWYFPDLTIDEMIVFVGSDSTRPYEPNTLHVAFEDTTVHDPVPRSSVETRYFALFD